MEKRDFFISYTKTNEAWAVWIANVLISHGYSVYVQALDIRPGDNFIEKMNEFLKNAENFIVVWSRAYSESRFCMTELQAAFNAWHRREIDCFLPVRIDSYPMEPLYSALVHVYLSGMSVTSEFDLMDAVRHAVPRPLSITNIEIEELNKLGNTYWWGQNGEDPDREKALEYYRQAAEKGSAYALTKLGLFLDLGGHYNQARDYYKQSAKKGELGALERLGVHYYIGLGIIEDYAKAQEYWEQAAENGDIYALWSLAEYYENGRAVTPNYAKALEYYQRAFNAGYRSAIEKVMELQKKLNL